MQSTVLRRMTDMEAGHWWFKEKRAILASWASDASAIASCPALRAPEGLKAPVTIDAILEALCELDGEPRQSRAVRNQRLPPG